MEVVFSVWLSVYPWLAFIAFAIMGGPLALGYMLDDLATKGLSITDTLGVVCSTMLLGLVQLVYIKCYKNLCQPLSIFSKQLSHLGCNLTKPLSMSQIVYYSRSLEK